MHSAECTDNVQTTKQDLGSFMSLKSSIWISAQIRQCDQAARSAMVVRRGDPDAGSIILRLDRLDGTCVLLSQIRDANGEKCWLKVGATEALSDEDANTYLEKRTSTDPDIWILEIEDRRGDYEADAPVLT